ncbi:multicopper oxidase family protein [Nonomuraea aridisoli]|uniref:multicopper oxidase family protein n=1 Tax=Nonomuraea aridisoli TaxID=2070368 RepID=UPI001C651C14|nr:multicopper oxidase family protein [Nonomuraea aridisoli]
MNGSAWGGRLPRRSVIGMFAALGAAPVLGGARASAAARPSWTVLRARPARVDLGRRTVATWAYDDVVPGRLIRATAGGAVRARLVNDLPAPTTVHWHGIRIAFPMDGAPGFSQEATRPGETFDYAFTVPDAGTYFYHSHVGMQNDRGLYGALIVEDPHEPLRYDEEYTVVLDDWLDGVNGTPDDELRRLNASSEHDDNIRSAALGGVAGETLYPYYLVNGRRPSAPVTFSARPGARARFRVINAAADTAFRFAIGGHRLTVTHTDGFPCAPVTVDTVMIGMGERYDVLVTLEDGAFPLVAVAEGKRARAFAVVRTSPRAAAPTPGARVPQLSGRMLTYGDLNARREDQLPTATKSVRVRLGMRPSGNEWTLNGRLANDPLRLRVDEGETLRIIMENESPMWHPMHLHGHTFQVRGRTGRRGPRKDTVNILPRERLRIDVHADNPGEWMFHCHNLYHQEQGMMGVLGYGPQRRDLRMTHNSSDAHGHVDRHKRGDRTDGRGQEKGRRRRHGGH